MSEINARWKREQRKFGTIIGYLVTLAIPLWMISYAASGPIYTMLQWQWFGAVSIVTLAAAITCSIGAAVFGGIMLTNDSPLDGSNR